MDLDEALQLPEELYIANKYQVSFDENGTIQKDLCIHIWKK